MPETNPIALTQYAHGAGCGCKIAPQVLSTILQGSNNVIPADARLLVGNGSNDDAAVYDLGSGMALIATTDFFMPIVDDAFDFGRVAAANAISDVYAMGGKPLMALAILGWPVNTLPVELAQKVMEGARHICAQAGLVLAGGHSIDTTEPLFGLCVNGLVHIQHLKRNNTAKAGDLLLMTKPLGTGILATAQKRKKLDPQDQDNLIQQLVQINTAGEALGKINGVSAMTDITGFGLLGHLMEMAEGSGVSARLRYDRVPKIKSIEKYIQQHIVPDATYRNWNAYKEQTQVDSTVNMLEAFTLLPDPQTNGGLLLATDPATLSEVQEILRAHGLHDFTEPVGAMEEKGEKVVRVV